MNRKILISGGAGYIGSVLSELLIQSGYFVRVVDNLSSGKRPEFIGQSNYEFVEGDICSKSDVSVALEDINCVVHLAAVVGDPACKKYSELATRVNKEGSELLYALSEEKGVKRFIFASTCSNYGKMPNPNGFVNEDTALNPISHYAELKVGFEKYLMENRGDGIKPVILRFSTAYGLSPRMRFDLTVNEFTRDILLGKQLEIYGEQFWRPYCHTVDLARAIIKVIEADDNAVACEAFNVGDNDENYQKKNLIDMILKQLPDKEGCVSYVHKEEDPRDYRVNFDKIKEKLGFSLTKTVPEGISEIIKAIEAGDFENPYDDCYKNL